jgi:excisionase family DNA binding protein
MQREQNPSHPVLLTPKQAAHSLAISPRTLWAMTASGTIPSIRIGRLIRYRVESLKAWLIAQESGEVNRAE